MENKNLTIYRCEQGSEYWHQLRLGRVTASKFSALMSGISTQGFKNLIYNTAGEIISGEVEEQGFVSEAMKRGTELEPEARMFYEDIKNIDVDEVGFVTNDKIYSEYVGVSPDGMIPEENGILEIKCPYMNTHISYMMNDKLPNAYKWQVQGQLLVTGAEYCDFMSYYPNIKPFIKRIYPDKDMHQELIDRMGHGIDEIKRIIEVINNK
jgi:putative phage-type endonuclease